MSLRIDWMMRSQPDDPYADGSSGQEEVAGHLRHEFVTHYSGPDYMTMIIMGLSGMHVYARHGQFIMQEPDVNREVDLEDDGEAQGIIVKVSGYGPMDDEVKVSA